MEKVQAILDQIGGQRRLILMTGAYGFTGQQGDGTATLSFRWKARSLKGANAVRVVLDPSDTYSVTFLRVRGHEVKPVSEHTDVYNEDLRPLFERVTGLTLAVPVVRFGGVT